MNDKELIDKMIDFRAKYNLSQGKLAEMCRVTTVTINSIERGSQTPSALTRRKILNVIENDKKGDEQ